jgi:tetratricopeptide (TPR) repeat protein
MDILEHCFDQTDAQDQALSFKLQVLQLLVRNLQQELRVSLQQKQQLNPFKQEKLIYLLLQVIYLQNIHQEYEGLTYSLLSYADLLLLCGHWDLSLQIREKSKILLRSLSPYLNHKNDDVIWEVECGICEILVELGQIDEVKKRLAEFTKDNPLFQVSNTTQAITPQINALSARIYYLLGICDLYAKDYPQATNYLSQASQIFKQLPFQAHYPKTLVALAHTLIETAMIFKKSNQNNMIEKVKHLLEGAKSYALIVQKFEKDDLFLLSSTLYLQLKVAFIKNEFEHLEHAILHVKQVRNQLNKLQNGKKPCFHALLISCLIELEILYQLDQQSQEKISLPYDFSQKGELQKLEVQIGEFMQSWQKWKQAVDKDSLGQREMKINAWELSTLRKRLQYFKKEEWIDGIV